MNGAATYLEGDGLMQSYEVRVSEFVDPWAAYIVHPPEGHILIGLKGYIVVGATLGRYCTWRRAWDAWELRLQGYRLTRNCR